jgi:hypothetical protein
MIDEESVKPTVSLRNHMVTDANFESLGPDLEAEARGMMATGNTVAAIKRIREATGCSLAFAKAWVDQQLAAGGFRKTWSGKPCPHCGKPLRTDMANQCFECGTDWHDASQ